jgi:hypothetical protein
MLTANSALAVYDGVTNIVTTDTGNSPFSGEKCLRSRRLSLGAAPTPTAVGQVAEGPERSGRVGELRQPLVVSGKQIEFVEDLFVLERRKASTDRTCLVAVIARLFAMLGGSRLWVRHHWAPP